MFTYSISECTDDNLVADIAMCRKWLAEGHINGVVMSGDDVRDIRDRLADMVEEQNIRSAPEDYETAVSVRRAA